MTTACAAALTASLLWAQTLALPTSPASPAYWHALTPTQARHLGKPQIQPRQYRVYRLSLSAVRPILAAATTAPTGPELQLPLPDGTLATFRMRTTTVMAPELAAKYPELQTYAGQEVNRPTNEVRLEITPTGLHALLIRQGRTYLIEPYGPANSQYYLCFAKDSLPPGSKQPFEVPPASAR
ncbi:hypothetical protein [Hymenobacter chitinivorans]|uniref:Uncharacterized protein n=1 Tax=Hymenobacter chitinivorans DSM 11115 TaxID=1121954 RepID=A0A2M9BLX3_9BACT|nr:hypothetical protein [Hymenobacter chitinivorans]PJJ58941.1 hypothetical protein CLV45_0353 [Hymenobacter chitinivorans DSM 11115]